MWTPGRVSSSSRAVTPFRWKKKGNHRKSEKKKGSTDAFSFISDDDRSTISSPFENPSPLVTRSLMPTPTPHIKNPHSRSFPSFLSLFRRASNNPTPSPKHLSATIYGCRRGRANLSLQENPYSEPILLLELAIATGKLVREMASGPVRILLECEEEQKLERESKIQIFKKKKKRGLWEEPVWTMFSNGERCGYAVSHNCGEVELEVLRRLEKVSVGAGVMTENFKEGEELMYMRAIFERVVEDRNSEKLYMVNPDGSGRNGPELSFFLVRS